MVTFGVAFILENFAFPSLCLHGNAYMSDINERPTPDDGRPLRLTLNDGDVS